VYLFLFVFCSEGLGSKILESGQFFHAQVSSDRVWVRKISPKNPKKFNFLLFGSKKSHCVRSKNTWVKDGSASYLLRVKSMVGLGHGPSLVF